MLVLLLLRWSLVILLLFLYTLLLLQWFLGQLLLLIRLLLRLLLLLRRILGLRRHLVPLLLLRRRRHDLRDAAALRHVGDAPAAVRAEVVAVLEPVQAAGQAGEADADDAEPDARDEGHARVRLVDAREAPPRAVRAVDAGRRRAEQVQGRDYGVGVGVRPGCCVGGVVGLAGRLEGVWRCAGGRLLLVVDVVFRGRVGGLWWCRRCR